MDFENLDRRDFIQWTVVSLASLLVTGCRGVSKTPVVERPATSTASGQLAQSGWKPLPQSQVQGSSFQASATTPISAQPYQPNSYAAMLPANPNYSGNNPNINPNSTGTVFNSNPNGFPSPSAHPSWNKPQANQNKPLNLPPQTAKNNMSAISRAAWKAESPIAAKLTSMQAVTRITVHHEGSKANWDTAADDVARDLRQIQASHRTRMKAADIGYHFVIDRAGRIWQGREVRYQGAHVSGQNSNNIGVMLLGNYEIQQPTQQQLASLNQILRTLAQGYKVPKGRIYCHCDLGATACPGKNVKPWVEKYRAGIA